MMLPKNLPALRVIGVSTSLKKGCLIPMYRDAGITFAQGLYRFDDVTDREFYESCIDALEKIFLEKEVHPVILVTVSKTMKKHLLKKGALKTESNDQFIINRLENE